ncbi:hypothetical protein GCM10023184_29160 [Flaviaesturariibacter amylovorans]|uniref:Uncharacterized protein n=2 Tax=Flaviaesturariibacter amylovorans TaxID=1084520 RepID=A0ABP8H6E2_9BACT
MADFEKGLMLAGLVAPSTVEELNEIRVLDKYEKELKKEKKNTYFKRVVLAAEIANELHAEPTLGRIKFQKLVYLCEHAAEMGLHQRYLKLTAGPFDNKFMHTIEGEFQRNEWFRVDKITERGITRSKYVPLANINGYKEYYARYFEDRQHSIRYVIDLFRKQKSTFTEIAATLFACFVNLKNANHPIVISKLLEEFYKWSERKTQFKEDEVVSVWNWMLEKGLVAV